MGEAVAKDTPALMECLSDMNEKIGLVNGHGIDVLELKNQLLLSYIVDLAHVVLLKCQGSGVSVAPVDRLVEIRTILEKMRPLEQRFSYQLDKLLRTVSSRVTSGIHPLQFKPAPENLVSKMAEEGPDEVESEEESGGSVGGTGVYVPPRVVAMPYNEGGNKSYPKSQVEKNRLVHELREEVTDLPAEVETFNREIKKQLLGEDRQRKRYEEDHMTRLPINRRKLQHSGQTEKLADIVDFSLFKGLVGQGASGRIRKKKKSSRR